MTPNDRTYYWIAGECWCSECCPLHPDKPNLSQASPWCLRHGVCCNCDRASNDRPVHNLTPAEAAQSLSADILRCESAEALGRFYSQFHNGIVVSIQDPADRSETLAGPFCCGLQPDEIDADVVLHGAIAEVERLRSEIQLLRQRLAMHERDRAGDS